MTENKIQAARQKDTFKDCLDIIKRHTSGMSLTDYERCDLALKFQANNIVFADGDYWDEHMYFVINALLGIRDTLGELANSQ